MSDKDLLTTLGTKITSLGEQIKTIKSTTPIDTEALTNLLPQLLEAKQAYANANNGLDIDGNVYQPPMSKAEKKKKAKEEKAKAAAAAGGGAEGAAAGGKQVR